MKYSKIVSLIVVLAMISIPLITMGEEDVSCSYTNTDVEKIPVDSILQGEHKDDYWVKATLNNDTIILSNNGEKKKPCILVDPAENYKKVILGGTAFTVPADSGIDLIYTTLDFNDIQVTLHGRIRIQTGEGNIFLTVDGGHFLAYNLSSDEFALNVKNNGSLEYLCWNEWMFIAEQLKSDDSSDGFTIEYDKTNETFLLSGTIIGKGPDATISPSNNLMIDNLVLKNLCFSFMNMWNDGNIILKNDFINVGTGSYFESYENNIPQIKSSEGEAVFASVFHSQGFTSPIDPESNEYGDVSFYACTVDENGIKNVHTTVQLMVGTAVEKIESGSQFGNYLLVGVNETINLDNIKVVCRDGYVFNGWYVINEYGYEEKIQDTQHFSTDSSVILVANAIPDIVVPPTPQQKDYTTYFVVIIAIIVVMALIGLLMILRNEGIIFKRKY